MTELTASDLADVWALSFGESLLAAEPWPVGEPGATPFRVASGDWLRDAHPLKNSAATNGTHSANGRQRARILAESSLGFPRIDVLREFICGTGGVNAPFVKQIQERVEQKNAPCMALASICVRDEYWTDS